MSQEAVVHTPQQQHQHQQPQHQQHQQQLPPTPPSESSPEPSNMSSIDDALSGDATTSAPPHPSPSQHKHIWVITGPAGCGKTSVAEHLHSTLSLPYLEGDTFHTPANVDKMAQGQPLTDADRWDWLVTLREESVKTLRASSSSSSSSSADGVIVTCSALKRKYRDVIRIAAYHHPEIRVHFVFLKATEALLMERVRARQNHYMKDYMVHSQFESLETPTQDETDVLAVDASGTSTQVQELALRIVKQEMASEAT